MAGGKEAGHLDKEKQEITKKAGYTIADIF